VFGLEKVSGLGKIEPHLPDREEGMGETAEEIARDLFEQHEKREKFVPFPDRVASQSEAYAIQDAFVPLMLKKFGTTVAGYKIALTSKQTQEWLKINEPCGGTILANRVHQSPYTTKLSDWMNFGIETEVCVVLDKDLPSEPSFEEVQKSLRSVHCAYELVEDRCADLTKLDPKSLVSDNSWNGGIVVGPGTSPDMNLSERSGRLKVNGKVVHEGTTRETMGGNPINVVMWLARNLGTRGKQIKAGDVIITGSIIATQFPKAGETLIFDVDGIPPVELRVEA
jgi:2-keto-4-pentenoate hydratase